MKIKAFASQAIIKGQWKQWSLRAGRKSGNVWGANGWPATMALENITGSSTGHYYPPLQPGWYITATWVCGDGNTHKTAYGNGDVQQALLYWSAIQNDPLDPMLPEATAFTKGLIAAQVVVALLHGKGTPGTP